MLDKLAGFADKYDMLPREGLILAAVSGGADSMCLLTLLLELSVKRGFAVAAAHYNHRLRRDESDRDARFVKDFCRNNNIILYSGSGDVAAFAGSEGIGIEEAARRLRYDFFYRTAESCDAKRIATAHTADDNAETVLLNLTRGTGLPGLSGIPPSRDMIIRPMLTLTKDEILDFLSQRGIPFVEDSTNALDICSRNIIRRRVIPVLQELNPRLSEHISVMTSLIRDDDAYINDIADTFIHEHYRDRSFSAAALALLPRPVSSRVIRSVYGNNLSAAHVSAILALCAPGRASGETALPSGFAFREYDRIVLSHGEPPDGFPPVELPPGGKIHIPELGMTVICGYPLTADSTRAGNVNKTFTSFLFKYEIICGKIVIRPRETGDKINLFGRNGTKTLKKLFIERRIPRRLRSLIPVIADENGVLAVYGIGIDNRAVCKAGDQTLEIIFEETAYET
ncbi:MAG: tRNA lysidine(34) synthetase TilS [Clostridiales bacterium]|nr:tRNA lysidine(34) synthetase TilS [Clostridiales bacterium]